MLIIYPTNADYLIDDVRLHIGDLDSTRYSDSVIRSAIVGGVKMLQRYWRTRYLVFKSDMITAAPVSTTSGYVYAALPEGYGLIPSGLSENDIFRNAFHTFTDPGILFSQEDEWPVILAATIILGRSQLAGSAAFFQVWEDGEYRFSNVASATALGDLYKIDLQKLDAYFKKRLSSGLRDTFPIFVPDIY